MMLGLPKLSCDPVLFLPLWLGTLRDASDYGNHATNTLSYWAGASRDALRFPATDRLTVVSAAELEGTSGTVFISGRNFDRQITADRIFSKFDAGGSQFEIRMTTQPVIIFGDGVDNRTAVISPTSDTRSLAVCWEAGQVPNAYKDAGSPIAFSGITNPTPNDAPISIGNFYTGTTPSQWDYECVIMYPAPLLQAEIARLHAYSQAVITPRLQWPGGGITTGNPKYVDNIQSARVNLATDTSGQLSNTGLSIITGAFAVTESAAGRAITCVGAGKLRRHLVGADGFTTQLFTQTGGATITKNASNFELDFGTGDTVTAIQLVA